MFNTTLIEVGAACIRHTQRLGSLKTKYFCFLLWGSRLSKVAYKSVCILWFMLLPIVKCLSAGKELIIRVLLFKNTAEGIKFCESCIFCIRSWTKREIFTANVSFCSYSWCSFSNLQLFIVFGQVDSNSLLCSRLLIQARHDSIHRIGGILGCYWMMGCKRVHVNGDSSRNGNGFESFSDIILI